VSTHDDGCSDRRIGQDRDRRKKQMEGTTDRALKEREGKRGRKEKRRRKEFCCGLKR